jgi:hypothetical protein
VDSDSNDDNNKSYLSESKRQGSPIKNDSELMRGQRDQFLRSFSEKRSFMGEGEQANQMENSFRSGSRGASPRGQQQKTHLKVADQSAYLRN